MRNNVLIPVSGYSMFLLQADTTSLGYKIGYQIGGLLPFLIIGGIALLVILRGYRHKGEGQ